MPRSIGGTSYPSSISDIGLEGMAEPIDPIEVDPNVAKLSGEEWIVFKYGQLFIMDSYSLWIIIHCG